MRYYLNWPYWMCVQIFNLKNNFFLTYFPYKNEILFYIYLSNINIKILIYINIILRFGLLVTYKFYNRLKSSNIVKKKWQYLYTLIRLKCNVYIIIFKQYYYPCWTSFTLLLLMDRWFRDLGCMLSFSYNVIIQFFVVLYVINKTFIETD